MSEKIIVGQIKHRSDSYENWLTANPVLLKGEIAITLMSPATEGGKLSVLIKVGDGVKTYDELPFLTAQAGDVPEWAKAATKPIYTAEEIEDLAEFINNEIQDTNTQYQIVADPSDTDGKTFIFQSKEKDEETWTNVSTLLIPDDITYELSSENAGQLTLTPSKGGAQTVQIVDIESDSEQITMGSTKVPTAGAVADYVDSKFDETTGDLNVEDAAVTGEFVTEVKQVDGKIEVARQKLTMNDISDLKTNSTYDEENNKLATMADIDAAAARVMRFKSVVATVAALPEEDNEIGDVYHVKSTKAEYVWAEKTDDEGQTYYEWEKLGNDMDLSAYATKDDVDDALALKQDLITETNKLSVDLVNGTATDEKDGLMSAEDKAKLDEMEDGAQENVIEKVIAGDSLVPINDKTVKLAKIAETGNIMDLVQDEGDIVILDGGNAFGVVEIDTNVLVLNGGNSSNRD